jgi:hypothetical protein
VKILTVPGHALCAWEHEIVVLGVGGSSPLAHPIVYSR